MVPEKPIGIAFDIGTTTIVGASVDMKTGGVIAESSLPNPQRRWGSDVLSRIEAIKSAPGVLDEMRASVIDACNTIIKETSAGRKVAGITVAGNTVMEHIFLGVSPEPLSRVPYKPAFVEAKKISAKGAGLDVDETAELYAFPIIGGFVGGDAVAVALSIGMGSRSGAILAIDIGTNSEILLSVGGAVYATSAAAGPAFEGGGLKYGMTAAKGAIESVVIFDDQIKLGVIGAATPAGICGSGLIEAAAALLDAGVIDRTGRLLGRSEVENNLSNRIKEGVDGNTFVLYRGARGEVTLSQADIRALQAAKSAIKAGIDILLKKASIDSSQIDAVYIAGAFGSNLRKEGLRKIGILDDVWLKDVRTVGDAALGGAVLALRDEKKREAEELAKRVKYVSLSGSAHFEKEFLRNMNF